MTSPPPPKLFVSYSWTSEAHQQWVIDLATALMNDGVEVILDKWDLRAGHDAHKFMEQMVTDPEIRKVVMVCNQQYAERADERDGGVGTETQIISSKIYGETKQDKFVAVLSEKDADGNPIVPTYYKPRIYIDLSSDEVYAHGYEQLVRWAHDKPVHIKPSIGETPAFLSDDVKPPLGTALFQKRALDSVRNDKPNRLGACLEYLERFASIFEEFRVGVGHDEFKKFDDKIIKSIDEFIPYRNEVIELFMTLGVHNLTLDEQREIRRFFESLYSFMLPPRKTSGPYSDIDQDNFIFIVHELLLYFVAIFLRYERFETVNELIRTPFYIGDVVELRGGAVSLFDFRRYMRSLEIRNKRLGLRRLSIRADMLKDRAATSGLKFGHLMQADFTLYIRNCMDSLRNLHEQVWWPETLVYAGDDGAVFEIFARAQSRRYFDNMKCLFDISDKQELDLIFQAIRERKLTLPRWDWDTIDPAALLGYQNLATRP